MSSEVFITGIDSQVSAKKSSSTLLDPVRVQHNQMKEIVDMFRNKVDGLIDKQRTEYITAYENHMHDVQKELHSLREKVAEIANDETKEVKTSELKHNQVKYKAEAIQLELDSDALRKKMRELVRKIYTVEKNRDWMLKKLRQAKAKYAVLIKERCRLFDELDSSQLSQASISNASSYTLELKHPSKTPTPYGKTTTSGAAGAAGGSRGLLRETLADEVHNKISSQYGVSRSNYTALPPINNVHAPTHMTSSPVVPLRPWDNVAVDKSTGSPSNTRSNNTKQRGGSLRASHSDHLLAYHNPLRLSLASMGAGGAGGGGAAANGSEGGEVGGEDQIDPRLLNGTFIGTKPQMTATNANTTGSAAGAAHPMQRVGSVPVFSGLHHVKVHESTHKRAEVESSAKGELIAGRARRRELEGFVRLCQSSLHKGPWSRVKSRPMRKLLNACNQQQVSFAESFNGNGIGSNNSNNRELLQLACELAVHPATYDAILQVLDETNENQSFAHMDYSTALDEPTHQLSEYIDDEGENDADDAEYIPIDTEELLLMGEGGAAGGGVNEGEEGALEESDSYDENRELKVHLRGSRDYQDNNNNAAAGSSGSGVGKPHSPQYHYRRGIVDSESVDGSLLEGDLVEYLKNERHQRKLRESGYYDIDDFMQFQ